MWACVEMWAAAAAAADRRAASCVYSWKMKPFADLHLCSRRSVVVVLGHLVSQMEQFPKEVREKEEENKLGGH